MEKRLEIAIKYHHAAVLPATGKKFYLCIAGSSQRKLWTVVGNVPGEESYGTLCACDNFGTYEFIDNIETHLRNHPV